MFLPRTSLSLAVALMAAGGAFAQELPPAEAPLSSAAVDDPSADGRDAATGPRVPLLTSGDGNEMRPAVRLIRNGAVVATGTLAADGGLNGNDLPPGIYSVAGSAGGAIALFAHEITADAPDESSLRLLAPATDRTLAIALLARRFPEAFATVGQLPAPLAAPSAALAPTARPTDLDVREERNELADPIDSPVRNVAYNAAANARKLAGGVTPGARGLVTQYDAEGVARPVPGAEVFLILKGRRVASLSADESGGYRLPRGLAPGLYTLVTVSSPLVAEAAGNAGAATPYGASVTGLNVVAGEPVAQKNPAPAGLFRTAALRRVQEPPFGPPTVPASDFPVVFDSEDDDDPLGAPFADGGGAGFGGGAGGGGGGLGGALIPALIGAGIGAAIASGDDDDDFNAGGDPKPVSPARPSRRPRGAFSPGDSDD